VATLTIRDFDAELKAELRVRAAKHGRSIEAEVRAILRSALTKPTSELGVARRIQQVLPFSSDSAHHCAETVTLREQTGKPISMADAQIAAICP
jgi:antitoxin FitA